MQYAAELLLPLNGSSVHLGHHIVLAKPCLARGPVMIQSRDLRAPYIFALKRTDLLIGKVAHLHTEIPLRTLAHCCVR